MKTLSPDTHSEAERFQIELIRKAPIFRRIQIVDSLVKTTRQLSWKGIGERYPEETEEERLKRFIFLLYGDESLAQEIIDALTRKKKLNK